MVSISLMMMSVISILRRWLMMRVFGFFFFHFIYKYDTQ